MPRAAPAAPKVLPPAPKFVLPKADRGWLNPPGAAAAQVFLTPAVDPNAGELEAPNTLPVGAAAWPNAGVGAAWPNAPGWLCSSAWGAGQYTPRSTLGPASRRPVLRNSHHSDARCGGRLPAPVQTRRPSWPVLHQRGMRSVAARTVQAWEPLAAAHQTGLQTPLAAGGWWRGHQSLQQGGWRCQRSLAVDQGARRWATALRWPTALVNCERGASPPPKPKLLMILERCWLCLRPQVAHRRPGGVELRH